MSDTKQEGQDTATDRCVVCGADSSITEVFKHDFDRFPIPGLSLTGEKVICRACHGFAHAAAKKAGPR